MQGVRCNHPRPGGTWINGSSHADDAWSQLPVAKSSVSLHHGGNGRKKRVVTLPSFESGEIIHSSLPWLKVAM